MHYCGFEYSALAASEGLILFVGCCVQSEDGDPQHKRRNHQVDFGTGEADPRLPAYVRGQGNVVPPEVGVGGLSKMVGRSWIDYARTTSIAPSYLPAFPDIPVSAR